MLVIGNGKLFTGGEEAKFFDDGAVVIDGEKIVALGDTKSIRKKYKNEEFLDAEGMIIMPGLINMHEHIYSAFARGLNIKGNNPKDFLEILEHTWWNIDRHLSLEETYYSAISTYIECIKNGVTTVNDHHASFYEIPGSLKEIAKAAELLGVRTSLCYETSDRDGEEKRDESISENANFINVANAKKSSMLKALFGLHASFTLSDETLKKCKEMNTSNAGYHVHVAEGIYDEINCEEKYNMTIVERLFKFGILGKKTLCCHAIHIKNRDLDLLKETRTNVIFSPESNMGNAVGLPDTVKMLDKGIRVGLGTDGYTNDILESLKAANIAEKHLRKEPDRGFSEAISCLKNNAAIASELFGVPLGEIKEGAAADIILMNYKPYTPMTSENFAGHLMFGMNGAMTDTTIINGKVLMRHRKLVNVNEDELLSKASESASELWTKINA